MTPDIPAIPAIPATPESDFNTRWSDVYGYLEDFFKDPRDYIVKNATELGFADLEVMSFKIDGAERYVGNTGITIERFNDADGIIHTRLILIVEATDNIEGRTPSRSITISNIERELLEIEIHYFHGRSSDWNVPVGNAWANDMGTTVEIHLVERTGIHQFNEKRKATTEEEEIFLQEAEEVINKLFLV